MHLKIKASSQPLRIYIYMTYMGFPCSSVGKESACNARDPCLIPGLGRSAAEVIGCPL